MLLPRPCPGGARAGRQYLAPAPGPGRPKKGPGKTAAAARYTRVMKAMLAGGVLIVAAIGLQLRLRDHALSYDEETRNDLWAPAMESAMRARLNPALLASLGLGDL